MNKTIEHSARILVVDDHPIVRKGIAALLCHTTAATIAEASCAAEAIDISRKQSVDIAVIDLELPDANGLQLITRLRCTMPQTRIVVYTMHEEPWIIDELQDANVDAIVLKGDDPYELQMAVESVKIGIGYYSSRFKKCADNAPGCLTEREKEVLQMMCDGMSSKLIAEKMCVSENTVEYHRKQILRRIGAKNNVQAVSIALKEGLLPMI
ncbi:MAG: response regulator transcription factor [Prevotella sp.]|uniref:response regulator transcription factor n=1 Tax=Prevotella sp. TaxID=59823 RepID=UPI0025EA9918|nr:response regulator transcription factor [Prevotella sp.]MCI7119917.1 response regulator transcription factor [Prevotella sp.]